MELGVGRVGSGGDGLGCLQVLDGFSLSGGAEFGHGFFGEVAAFGDGPFVVGLDDHGGDESQDAGVVGEYPDDVGAPLDLAVDRSK
jgi:hypothetical protein